MHDKIAELDAHIASLERQLVEVKRCRNALTSLCRLPPELLGRIIVFAQVEFRGSGDELRAQRASPASSDHTPFPFLWPSYSDDWRNLIRVCSHLRAVALHTPDLWAYLDSQYSNQWVDVCTERAKHTPAVLNLSGPRICPGFQERLATAHYASIVLAPSIHDMSSCLAMMERAAPRLDTLLLRVTTTLGNPLPRNLLNGRSTMLRTLSLKAFAITEFPDLPSLRNLHLDSTILDSGLNTLFALFSRSPHLEIVALRRINYQTSRSCTVRGEVQPVSLPALRMLKIEDGPERVCDLLRGLPDPQVGLFVNAWSDHRVAARDPYCQSEVAQRVCDFYLQKVLASQQSHIDAALIPDWSRSSLTLGAAFDTAVDGHPQLYYNTNPINAPDDVLALIGTCVIRHHCFVLLNGHGDFLPLTNKLSNLRRMVITHVTESCAANGLSTWMSGREATGRPVQEIKFRDCGDHVKAMAEGVAQEHIGTKVYWDGAEIVPTPRGRPAHTPMMTTSTRPNTCPCHHGGKYLAT
jgi:hypothetical protein